jgi:hypothetical protein
VSDQALRELLRSPLDDRPRRAPAPRLRAFGFTLVGAVVGAAAAFAVLALLDEPNDEPPAAEATTTTAPTGPAVLGEGLRAEAAWVMERGDSVLVGVHVIAEPGSEAALPASAAWSLRLSDGRVIPFRADFAAFLAPGAVTVEFPARGIELAELDALIVRPAVAVFDLDGTWEVETDELPWLGPAPGPIVATEDFTMVASRLRIGDDGGAIEWQLFGGSGRRAELDAQASWTVPGDDEPRIAVAEYRIGGAPLQLAPLGDRARSSGSLDLYRLDDPDAPTFRSRWWGDPGEVQVEGLSVEFRVTVYEYAEDGIPVPLADVPVLVG